MYNIEIANQQSLLEIDEALIQSVAARTLETEQTTAAEISIALVDDPAIHEVNRQHLDHDYPTDVISFLFDSEVDETSVWPGLEGTDRRLVREAPEEGALRGRHKRIDGEIIVSTETALAKAAELNCDPQHELLLYVIHGLLHLVGYDDIDDDERLLMRSRERAILDICELAPGVDS